MIPDPNDQQVSLSDAIREQADNPELDFEDIAAEKVEAQEPAWEAPDWTKRWKPEARDALGRFAKHPELRSYYDQLRPQLEETNAYITRRDQEYADYRKRLDPIYQAIQPYEQRYALNGIPLQQGIQQLFSAAEMLNNDPDQAFPWLAGSSRPRDPAGVINRLAQQWGVSLDQAVWDQPYVDPTVTALLNPLQQQVQQMQYALMQQQQAAVTQQQQALVSEISDFEAAQDENGNLLHPHFGAVFDDMTMLVQMGRAKDLPTAYKLATQYNPQLAESNAATAAENARKKAIAAASARTAAAEKSEKASRTVTGKGRGSQQQFAMTLKEGFNKAMSDLGEEP